MAVICDKVWVSCCETLMTIDFDAHSHSITPKEAKIGVIVVDESRAVLGRVSNGFHDVIDRMSVDLPKKHGRGGASAMRYAKIRLEKRQKFMIAVVHRATELFGENGSEVSGLVVAGANNAHSKLVALEDFNAGLSKAFLTALDVSEGGDAGFEDARIKIADALASPKTTQQDSVLPLREYCFVVDARGSKDERHAIFDAIGADLPSRIGLRIVEDDDWEVLPATTVRRNGRKAD